MTRMTGPDCVVMCNLINTYIHTYIQPSCLATILFPPNKQTLVVPQCHTDTKDSHHQVASDLEAAGDMAAFHRASDQWTPVYDQFGNFRFW